VAGGMGRAERLVESVAPQRDRVGRRGLRGPRRAELTDLELFAERLDVVLELQRLPRLDAERTDAQPTWAQEGGVERGAGGCRRRRDVSRDGGNPAVPDGAAGAGQRRSGSAAAAARRAVPEARAGALRRWARVPHRRAAGPGGALRERERAAGWGVKAASSSWGPSVALSAAWSGFTQKLSDINPTIAGARSSAAADSATCAYANSAWFNAGSGQPLLDCTQYAFS